MTDISTTELLDRLDVMKREIDALQIDAAAKKAPWYTNVATIVSALALIFSFGTTFVSYRRVQTQDIQDSRRELRGLLQRLAALPKENIDLTKKYQDDPAAQAMMSGSIGQENALIARQAAELARRLPDEFLSAAELQGVGVALVNAYELVAGHEFLADAVAAATDFNTELGARRALSNLDFVQGNVEAGRNGYKTLLAIFSKYPGYDTYTQTTASVQTRLAWAYSEANAGSLPAAREQIGEANALVDSLPRSPMALTLRSQVGQAGELFAAATPGGLVNELPQFIPPQSTP